MLLLTLIVFSLTTVYSTSRISAPDFQAVNFAKAKEMRKLNESVIKQVDVMSENECSLQCISDERCLSYNFGNKRNKSGTFVCELSDSDRFLGFGNFTEDVNFTYRGMQVTIAAMADAALSLIYYYYHYYYYYYYYYSIVLVSLNQENPACKRNKTLFVCYVNIIFHFLISKKITPKKEKRINGKKKILKSPHFFCSDFIE